MGGTRILVGLDAGADVVRVTPGAHRLEETLGSLAGEFILGEADTQPVVALIVQLHVAG